MIQKQYCCAFIVIPHVVGPLKQNLSGVSTKCWRCTLTCIDEGNVITVSEADSDPYIPLAAGQYVCAIIGNGTHGITYDVTVESKLIMQAKLNIMTVSAYRQRQQF